MNLIYSLGQMFTYTSEEYVAVLSLNHFLQVSQTTLSQNSFLKFGTIMNVLQVLQNCDQIGWLKNYHSK